MDDTFENDVKLLGKIAFAFRDWNTRLKYDSDATDPNYEQQYAEVVQRLIKSGKWVDCPPPEDQLPTAMMPEAFYDYWNLDKAKFERAVKERNKSETIQGVFGLIVMIATLIALFYVMSACGGCWDSGSRLFLK